MSDTVFSDWKKQTKEEERKNKLFSCCVIILKDDEVLLLKRGDTAPVYPGLWGFPGGGSEEGENWEECARRETYEESGLEIGSLAFVSTKVGQSMKNVYFFKTYEASGEVDMEKVLDEHTDFAWVKVKDLEQFKTTPDTIIMVRKALKKDING